MALFEREDGYIIELDEEYAVLAEREGFTLVKEEAPAKKKPAAGK